MANKKVLSKVSKISVGYQQGGWSTPLTTGSTLVTTHYNALIVKPDLGETEDEYEITSLRGIWGEEEKFYIDERSGLSGFNFEMVPDRNNIAPFFVGALQAVTESGSSPYFKTIGQGISVIDFQDDGGYLHTQFIHPQASSDDGMIFENCIISTLTLEFDFVQKGVARLGKISGSWVGNEANVNQDFSSYSPSDSIIIPYNTTDTFSFNTFTVDGVDWSTELIRKIVYTYNSNVVASNTGTNGKPSQYTILPEIMIEIHLDYNSTTEKILGDYQSGADVDIDFSNNISNGTAGHLRLDAPYCKIMEQPFEYSGDYNAVVLKCKAYQHSGSYPLTVYIADNYLWGYSQVIPTTLVEIYGADYSGGSTLTPTTGPTATATGNPGFGQVGSLDAIWFANTNVYFTWDEIINNTADNYVILSIHQSNGSTSQCNLVDFRDSFYKLILAGRYSSGDTYNGWHYGQSSDLVDYSDLSPDEDNENYAIRCWIFEGSTGKFYYNGDLLKTGSFEATALNTTLKFGQTLAAGLDLFVSHLSIHKFPQGSSISLDWLNNYGNALATYGAAAGLTWNDILQ